MKLLLLEDDVPTSTALVELLVDGGHGVDVCERGREAIRLATCGDYQVLILDRMLPDMSGLQVLRTLRAAEVSTPVLFLTGMAEVDDRVEGLEAGADDYLAKPFAIDELLARIAALGRRRPLIKVEPVLRVNDLELDRIKRRVRRAERTIVLPAQEFRLLEYLMMHMGEVVTRTALLDQLWAFDFDPRTNLVECCMSRLRARVDRSFGRPLIETVHGAGYRLRAASDEAEDRPKTDKRSSALRSGAGAGWSGALPGS